MKYIFVILALTCSARAAFVEDVDWSTVKYRRPPVKLPFDLQDVVFEERVVGGEIAAPNSLPYQAALIVTASTGTYLCGGALVSRRHVVTAGHCLLGAAQVQVRLGAHYWNVNEATQQRFFTTDYKIHNGWNEDLLINDLGIVQLQEEATLNEFVQVVRIPGFSDINTSFAGATGTLSGWGVYSDTTSNPSDVLRRVDSRIITNIECNISFLGVIIIRPTQLCISGDEGRGACTGDSGSPLVINNQLVGIVSFNVGMGCETGWPSVFTRVTHYLDWLQRNTDAVIT